MGQNTQLLLVTHCLRGSSPCCKWVAMVPAQVLQGSHGLSGVVTVLSEWILYGSWGGEAEGEVVLKPERCHASEEPDSAMPDQQRWCTGPNNSDCPA